MHTVCVTCTIDFTRVSCIPAQSCWPLETTDDGAIYIIMHDEADSPPAHKTHSILNAGIIIDVCRP